MLDKHSPAQRWQAAPMQMQHLPQVVAAHQQAFPGYKNTRLGPGYLRAMIRWFVECPTAISLVAISEQNHIGGYVVGAPVGYSSQMTKSLLLPAMKAFLLRPWLMFNRDIASAAWNRLAKTSSKRPILAANQELPRSSSPGVMSLVGIGVTTDCQRLGLGSLLMRSFENACQTKGVEQARLSVYAWNHSAQAFYIRHGWELRTSATGKRDESLEYVKSWPQFHSRRSA